MTQEEKLLLIKDLCARLPYGVICFAPDYEYGDIGKLWCVEPFEDLDPQITVQYPKGNTITKFCSEVKPYLRPMSNMTKEEKKEYESFFSIGEYSCGGSLYGTEYEYIADSPDDISQSICLFDWLNAHHFDYRRLIEDGLALEAPEGMYRIDIENNK